MKNEKIKEFIKAPAVNVTSKIYGDIYGGIGISGFLYYEILQSVLHQIKEDV